jgi:hypothetical protein
VGRRVRRLAPLVAVLGLAAAAGPAAADVRFEGRTSQGRFALLVAEDDGVPKRSVIRWRARCAGGGTLRQFTTFRRPFDLSTAKRIRDAGTYRSRRYRGGLRLTIRVRLLGRKVGPRRWRGTFGARVIARVGGRETDRCAALGVRWSVRR